MRDEGVSDGECECKGECRDVIDGNSPGRRI